MAHMKIKKSREWNTLMNSFGRNAEQDPNSKTPPKIIYPLTKKIRLIEMGLDVKFYWILKNYGVAPLAQCQEITFKFCVFFITSPLL